LTEREIILGYDPQHGGEDVLRLGRLFAEVLAAKPRVVTAVPWPDYLVGLVDIEHELAAETRDRFAYVAEELGDLGVTTQAIASRSPASALHALASADGVKMLVVGSCHRGPVGRTLAGSVGESLLQGAPCAVAIAPRDYAEREQEHLQSLAVAFDGSPESWVALETAIGMAERCHATVTVLTVADFPVYGYTTTWSILSEAELRDAERVDKARLLQLALARIPDGLERHSRVLTGDPADQLAAASSEFDLLITGSRSWGPLKRTMLGSTTRRLIRASSCPVLVLPRGAGVDPLGLRSRPVGRTRVEGGWRRARSRSGSLMQTTTSETES
jgi:nucleotide-binding universal stress UspA family protein